MTVENKSQQFKNNISLISGRYWTAKKKHEKHWKQAGYETIVIKDVISGPLHQEQNSKKSFGLRFF